MRKILSKITALSVGLAMVIGGGVALSSRKASPVKATPSTIMNFDFEDESAHRTSGNNSYAAAGNTYSQHGATIQTAYADSVTTGSPLSGSANIMGRIARNSTNSPSLVIGPIDLSGYSVTGFTYLAKTPAAFTLTASYSTNGSAWTVAETHTSTASQGTFTSSDLEIKEPETFYIKIVMSVASSTTYNRDGNIDNVIIYGESTGSEPLKEISREDLSVGVTGSANLANGIIFTPSDAANKNVSYAVKSGSQCIELNDDGSLIGIKGGTAVVTITPEDTSGGAKPIDVNVTVNSISAPGIVVGEQYVIYCVDSTNGNFELVGLSGSIGTSQSFNGDVPSCSYVLDTEEGYFENTVSFKNGTKYLSLTSSGNNINAETSITKNSSWIVEYNSTTNEALIRNAVYSTRTIQHNYNNGSPRFACYSAEGQTAISLFHYINESLENFTFDDDYMNVYVSGSAKVAVTYEPASASDKELVWDTGDESIATVDDEGNVTGVAVGQTTITASKIISGVNVQRTITVNVLNNMASHNGTATDPFNVEDAVNVAKGIFVKTADGSDVNLENQYYVKGLVTHAVNRTTTTLTLWIGDNAEQTSAALGGFELYKAASVYGVALATAYTANAAVVADFPVGSTILVKSIFTVYSETPETSQNVADVVWSSMIEARKYAEVFNSNLEGICDEDGNTDVDNLSSEWVIQKGLYNELDPLVQEHLSGAEAKTTSSATDVEKCAAKYDYICGRYGENLCENPDFMTRNPVQLRNPAAMYNEITVESESAIAVIVIVAVTSMSLLGVLLVMRKRKHQ